MTAAISAALAALLLVAGAAAQTPDAQGNPWPDSNSALPNSQSQSGFSGSLQPASSYGGAPENFTAPVSSYTSPSGGFSAPYGYQGSFARNAGAPFNFNSNQNTGIVSSRMQAPLLPEGLVLPVQLDTTIDLDRCDQGDYVQTHLSQNISSGGAAYLPGGSVISGVITKVPEEGHFGRSGKYSIDFTQVRLPNGTLVPMKAHLVGRIGTYLFRDPTSAGSKMASAAWRNGLGSSLSWGSGSAFASVADHGYGPGSGAVVGDFMGGASSLLSSLVYRHHHSDTYLHPGTRMELQLDAAQQLPGMIDRPRLPGSGARTGIFILMPELQFEFPNFAEADGNCPD
ncbi:MAG: hypothetical protein K2X27_11975 [Candidatus Obscuribacterales bacterium]|nr:hypothetical protein [Candidatus Obscuribacterales bacterium]